MDEASPWVCCSIVRDGFIFRVFTYRHIFSVSVVFLAANRTQ